MSLAALLLLADSRLPAGGHAHSGGVEAAVAAHRVHDIATLEAFLCGRLQTAGLVAAAFCAAACAAHPLVDHGVRVVDPRSNHDPNPLINEDRGGAVRIAALDAGLDARTASPALRKASRGQGRALLRAGRAMWTLPPLPSPEPHHAVALGVVAGAAGLTPQQAALAATYTSAAGAASAAVRILALDPYPVQALLASLVPECDAIAERAAALRACDVDDLPALATPLLDISAEAHATWEVRLFAS